ncbi:MAG: hypothetical protein IJU76_10175 [Desulfovibrionaceae bacterium]|nr:hypothetical protein [Desulfovibrionaceae bacterium]
MNDICVLHANCQGEVLKSLLDRSSEFTKKFTIHYYVNYTREAIAPSDIENCSLFLYQNLGPHFGDLSSAVLLSRIPQSCQAIRIPNLFFKGYWPFWMNDVKIIEFADSVLERLIALKLDPQEILRMYLSGAHPAFNTIRETAKSSLAQDLEKLRDTGFSTVQSLFESLWQKEQLFYTINHPGLRLSVAVANDLLRLLSLPRLNARDLQGFVHPYADFIHPIHPIVGTHLSLPFTGAAVTYPVYGKMMTHKNFVLAYLTCRLLNVSNFAAYLNQIYKIP